MSNNDGFSSGGFQPVPNNDPGLTKADAANGGFNSGGFQPVSSNDPGFTKADASNGGFTPVRSTDPGFAKLVAGGSNNDSESRGSLSQPLQTPFSENAFAQGYMKGFSQGFLQGFLKGADGGFQKAMDLANSEFRPNDGFQSGGFTQTGFQPIGGFEQNGNSQQRGFQEPKETAAAE